LPLDQITDAHGQQYAARLSNLSPSTINCGLRALRRALNLANEWGVCERRPKITLAKGERQRERVLTDAEANLYLAACDQPWKDAATIMLGTRMRPGDVFALRWENIRMAQQAGMLQIVDGKSRAAKRVLPMMPAVRASLETRWAAQGQPKVGWVFASGSKSDHLQGDSAKNQHTRALADIADAQKQGKGPALDPFVPYTLRHTALTRFGESGCDPFALARIAGHSSITVNARYVHPGASAIQQALEKLAAGHKTGHNPKRRLLKAERQSHK
jgi:integrase